MKKETSEKHRNSGERLSLIPLRPSWKILSYLLPLVFSNPVKSLPKS